jgi:Holliday junction resolvase
MGSKSKNKGSRFERECVSKAKSFGLEAVRAWGSDGRSLGMEPEVDMTIEDFSAQCKVRRRIAKWIKPKMMDKHIQLVKEDRGEIYAILRAEDLFLLFLLRKETLESKNT